MAKLRKSEIERIRKTVTLDQFERELASIKTIIGGSSMAFWALGRALTVIKNSGSYLIKYDRWTVFVRCELGLKQTEVMQSIKLARNVKDVVALEVENMSKGKTWGVS